MPLVLDDFEAGVGKWTLNDSAADEGGGTPRLCSIMATREVPPDSTGQQSGAIRFLEAERGWASVSIPVDGPALARSGLGQVAFWVRGERDGPRVEVAFRAVYDNPATGHRDLDVAYETQLALDDPEWRLVAIPFRRFETEFGKPLGPSDLTHITLFQFVQKPSVAPVSFLIDDLALEPAGYVRPRPAPPRAKEVPRAVGPRLRLPDALSFDVNFGYRGVPLLLQVGASLPADASPLLEQGPEQQRLVDAIRGLAPCVVRLKLSSFYATGSSPAGGRADASGLIDEARLQDALRWIVTAGARPLLCIDRLPNASMSVPAFANLCGSLATSLAGRPGAPHYEIWHEPVFREQFASVEEATDAYCTVAEAVKAASPAAQVGGMGFDAAWEDQLDYFVHHAEPLDFVSLHFYGAHTTSSSDPSLFAAALAGRAADLPRQLSFREVRRLIREACGEDVQLYVTEANVNSALDREGLPRDPRARGPFAGAWLAALAASASPYVDKLLWHPLYGEGWGLLDDSSASRDDSSTSRDDSSTSRKDGGASGSGTPSGEPPPTFSWLAARTIATYAPRGGSLCRLASDEGGCLLCATQSGVLRSAICIVAANQDPTVRINFAGIDRPGAPRLRVIAPDRAEVRQDVLPEGPRQQVQVEGPGIAVIQFIGAP